MRCVDRKRDGYTNLRVRRYRCEGVVRRVECREVGGAPGDIVVGNKERAVAVPRYGIGVVQTVIREDRLRAEGGPGRGACELCDRTFAAVVRSVLREREPHVVVRVDRQAVGFAGVPRSVAGRTERSPLRTESAENPGVVADPYVALAIDPQSLW